ncbi:MAG: hypothetical protein IKI60_02220 [Alloprevotella sp.]|nr:hypothetical protein [Alloprevotella sp.]
MRSIFFSLFFLLSFVNVVAQSTPCLVEAKADTTDMLIGEQTKINVTAKVAVGARVVFPEYAPEEMMVPGLEVVASGKIDTTKTNDGKMWELKREYTVTSFDSALYSIVPEVYLDGDTIKSRSAIGLKVESIPVDTTKLDSFVEPYGCAEEDFTLDWIFVMAVVLLIATLVLMGILLKKFKSKKPLPVQTVIEEVTPPHREALASIEKLKLLPRNTREENETYYSELSAVLRKYLLARYGFDALKMTTSEIVHVLINGQNVGQLNELGEILKTSDMVKFAQYSASLDEGDKNLLQAANYIFQTRNEIDIIPPRTLNIETKENKEIRAQRKKMLKYIILLGIAALLLTAFVVERFIV